jgi:hypothetical protein
MFHLLQATDILVLKFYPLRPIGGPQASGMVWYRCFPGCAKNDRKAFTEVASLHERFR